MDGKYNIERYVKSLESLEKSIEEDVKGINEPLKIKNRLRKNVLFRGHEKSSWKLETTLERYLDAKKKKMSFRKYNLILERIYPRLSSYTKKNWPFKKGDDYYEWLDHKDFTPQNLANYEFMVYLRQHGFPSPLLDWSESLYIALFFAYQKVNISEQKEDVSIIMYSQDCYDLDAFWDVESKGRIYNIGPNVNSHIRHFRQQGDYTIAVKKQDDVTYYVRHEEGFEKARGGSLLTLCKYNMPSKLKFDILSKLNEMNINAYTLFSNEETLMEHLANMDEDLNMGKDSYIGLR